LRRAPDALRRAVRESGAEHRLFAWLVLLGVLVPFGVSIGAEWTHRADIAAARGDLALIESATFAASRFERTLGPYSQFGFAHPGPLPFYVLAPFYRLFGMHAVGLHVGATFLALLSIGVVASVFARDSVRSPLRVLLGASVLLLGFSGLARDYVLGIAFTSPWNPTIAAFALLATAAAAAAARAGDDRYLPVVVFAHALASQAHVTTALAATPMLVLAFRPPTPPRPSIRWLAIALGLVLWSVSIVEVVAHRGGNLIDVILFATSDPRRDEGRLDLVLVLRAISWPIDGIARAFGRNVRLDPIVLAIWSAALGTAAFARRASARSVLDTTTRARLDVSLAGLAGALVVVPFLRGHSVPYLLFGVGVPATFLHVTLAYSVPATTSRSSLVGVAALGSSLTVALACQVALESRETSLHWFGDQRPAAARIDAIARCLAHHEDVAIRWRGPKSWVFGATAALATLEEGRVPELEPSERFRSGEPFDYAWPRESARPIRWQIETSASNSVSRSDRRRALDVTSRIETVGLDVSAAARARDCHDAR